MFTYTLSELHALRRYDVTPRRAVSKIIFSLRLWRPRLQRRHAYRKQQHAGISNFSIDAATLSCSLVNARSVGNKSASLSQMIVDARLDMLLITETWHENTESVSLKRVTPNGYKCIDAARPLASEHVHKAELRNYGGIAFSLPRQRHCHEILTRC